MATLELRQGPSGLRHYLEGRLVNGGDTLEICFSGGWVTGRYEWSRGMQEHAHFHCSIELDQGRVAEHSFQIPEGALLRWT